MTHSAVPLEGKLRVWCATTHGAPNVLRTFRLGTQCLDGTSTPLIQASLEVLGRVDSPKERRADTFDDNRMGSASGVEFAVDAAIALPFTHSSEYVLAQVADPTGCAIGHARCLTSCLKLNSKQHSQKGW